jgi:queuine tRNA-ribosyltransferase
MKIKKIAQKNLSRLLELQLKSGKLKTPFFMPDATRASVRGLTTERLLKTGIEAMVVNTYHLFLQPKMNLIRQAGGIHKFMNWNNPLLSDSGGYQVYSLIHKNPELGKITEEGAIFKSVLDGAQHLLTPELAIQIQFDLGVDMMVVLDDPRPITASREIVDESVERTIRWAERCKIEYEKQIEKRNISSEKRPLLFSVVQGGVHVDLREKCADGLKEINFAGYGFGGRHIDDEGNFLTEVMQKTASYIPTESVRFALGIGRPSDIVQSFLLGWDMFDCVIPSREGRHGRLFIWKDKNEIIKDNRVGDFYETLNIGNSKFKNDFSPIDEDCDCYACTNHSRSYIRHLFQVKEPLGPQLATIHNLKFYMELMGKLKRSF